MRPKPGRRVLRLTALYGLCGIAVPAGWLIAAFGCVDLG